LTVALSGANGGSFTLSTASISSIAAGGTGSFTVGPNTGLSAGTYTATVRVSGGNSISADFTVSFKVLPPFITETARDVNYTLRAVPGGTVTTGTTWASGSNYPLPQTISAFYMGETEITYELWKAVYDWATDSARGGE
jgi:formylglycine-generating enzyme required for sulfatase activity